MADQRILVGVAATLSWQPVDSDGTAADPGATVTVTVTRADGTAIATAAATAGTSSSQRTYTLAAANNTLLDRLTVSWLVGGTATASTEVEVVGGYWASIAQIRASDPVLGDQSRYTNAELIAARWETEDEFEDALGYACVPRYHHGRYSGTGASALALTVAEVRRVRSARVYDTTGAYTSLSATELASIPATPDPVALRTDAGVWPAGSANLVLEVEHGLTRPHADLLRAFYSRVMRRAQFSKGGAPAVSQAFQAADGIVVGFARPGVRGSITGDDRIDEVLNRRARRSVG